jgi:asparagine synthase (glutamine-hydrolysing)
MCGISGIVSVPAMDSRDALARMVSATQHRGPDAEGAFFERVGERAAVALGHNRLSIVDLSEHAAQPMQSRDGRFVLVYNGEVYNYKEIAKELDQQDLPEWECGDTAIVLAALVKWGPEALRRFNGMWALLLYDRQEKTLLVSRDRFGVKPLYYYHDGHSLYFASEVKGILAATGAMLSINADVAVPYMTRGLLNFSDETFFVGIKQFPPASFHVFDIRSPEAMQRPAERFWWHPFERGIEPVAGEVSPEEIRSVFVDAVRLRLRSDVPVGLLLSGGIDSSAILGAIASLGQTGGITVFSVISDDPRLSEEPFIDRMSEYVGLRPEKINVSKEPVQLLEGLNDANWYNDEPVCGIGDLAYLRLIQAARTRGIKVLLSGQGADEQLGGYNKFFYFWLMTLAREGRYVEAIKTFVQSARHSNTVYEFRLSEAIRYLGRRGLATGSFIAAPYQARDCVDLGLHGSYARREWIDLAKTSVPQLLHYEDRMSMSESVEVRVPFLDFRLVELLARVDPSEKFAGGWTKAIFRKAIAGMVPVEIQYRRDKKGFNVPEDVWMKREFAARVLEMFSAPMMAEDLGLIDRRQLLVLYGRFLRDSGILNGRHFLRTYIFENFLHRFSSYVKSAEARAA